MKNKRTMRKMTLALCIVCLATGMLIGCGKKDTAENPPENTETVKSVESQTDDKQDDVTAESDQEKYARLYKENAKLKAEFDEIRSFYIDNRKSSTSTENFDYEYMSKPHSGSNPEVPEGWNADITVRHKTIDEIRESLPDLSGIQVPDVAEENLSEQIEILEHNKAEYERLINEMIMELDILD
jgi:hypothetical protein